MSPQFNDTDDDIALPRRGDGHGAQASARGLDRTPVDREVTLNTGIVLALFFALALLCAVFFGFGYSIGHKSSPPAPVAANDNPPASVPMTGSTSASKPSPATAAVPDYVPSAGTTRTVTVPAVSAPAPKPAATTATVPEAGSKPAPILRTTPPIAEAPAAAAAPGSGTVYVQVAAVSHREDADVLVNSLHRRGYTVLTRTDANDHLIHVQIGPYPTRKDADTMRQKLLGDGYNAILK